MKGEDTITGLLRRLHDQGVTASRADLESFAADLPRALAPDEDIDALAARFGERQAAALRRRRFRAWKDGLTLTFIGINHLFCGSLSCLSAVSRAGSRPVAGAIAFVAFRLVFFTAGAVATFCGLAIAFGRGHELRRRVDALFQGRPPADKSTRS